MEFLYQSNNGWAVSEQVDLVGNMFYCIYRYYPCEKDWIPFKTMGSSLELCFIWLWRCNYISADERNYQISLLKG